MANETVDRRSDARTIAPGVWSPLEADSGRRTARPLVGSPCQAAVVTSPPANGTHPPQLRPTDLFDERPPRRPGDQGPCASLRLVSISADPWAQMALFVHSPARAIEWAMKRTPSSMGRNGLSKVVVAVAGRRRCCGCGCLLGCRWRRPRNRRLGPTSSLNRRSTGTRHLPPSV